MSPAVAPVDTAQQSQEAVLLHSALMRISEEKREVLVLSRFQDLKYEEIAELLGCEVNTVKTRCIAGYRNCARFFISYRARIHRVDGDQQEPDPAPGVCNELRSNWRTVTRLSPGQAQP